MPVHRFICCEYIYGHLTGPDFANKPPSKETHRMHRMHRWHRTYTFIRNQKQKRQENTNKVIQ